MCLASRALPNDRRATTGDRTRDARFQIPDALPLEDGGFQNRSLILRIANTNLNNAEDKGEFACFKKENRFSITS